MIYAVLSGALAALFSFYLNTKALNLGRWAIIYVAPFVEEFTKTYFALVLSSSVLLSHMTFGIVEALNDIVEGKSFRRYLAGGIAFVSHSIFGVITDYMIRSYRMPLKAVICSYLLHSIFNMGVLWFDSRT